MEARNNLRAALSVPVNVRVKAATKRPNPVANAINTYQGEVNRNTYGSKLIETRATV
jgi:hypothetical protein